MCACGVDVERGAVLGGEGGEGGLVAVEGAVAIGEGACEVRLGQGWPGSSGQCTVLPDGPATRGAALRASAASRVPPVGRHGIQ